ncbi:MAG: polymer-forming cytoskeletal protein [Candidatus Saccharimonadales bacterium]
MAKKSYTPANLADTVIAHDLRIKGDLTSDNDIWIDGQVEGNVTTHGNLSIGANGTITGDLIAHQVRVAGTVIGNIQAEGTLSCGDTAQITGSLQAGDLAVSSGAVIRGEVNVTSILASDEEE